MTAPKNRINSFHSAVVFPLLIRNAWSHPFNDQKLFGLALDSFNVRKHICSVTDMFENDLLFRGKNKSVVSLECDKSESETPLCDLNQNKIGICFEARSRSACSPRKERHAIFRLIKALVMLLHVRK